MLPDAPVWPDGQDKGGALRGSHQALPSQVGPVEEKTHFASHLGNYRGTQQALLKHDLLFR